jgi:hypothetical protein
MAMIVRTTITRVASPVGMPILSSSSMTRSSTIHVLIATQPVAMTACRKAGRYAPRRPKALRDRTIWLTPVRWPIRTKDPNSATPTAFPTARTRIVSHRPRPRTIPSAPRIQLIGAMLAPAQIQNWCIAVESRSASATGSIRCSSSCVAGSDPS